IHQQAQITLTRLLPSLQVMIPDPEAWRVFLGRLDVQFPRLFELLLHLYGDQYDFFYHLEQMLASAAALYAARPPDLKALDLEREGDRTWFTSNEMVGAVLYVDLFAGDFDGVREKIPYLQDLGVTYLHLMPLFRAPEVNSDGGYAVSSYRHTNPALGSMDDLRALATELRAAGISLVLDFIFNHTSNEHTWALRARDGEARYQRFYRLFPDRTMPDQYQATLREIFPEQAPGSFTWNDEVNAWVWTTFYHFQWDLNYENPEVLIAMMGEMLFLANVGVEVLRLDAVAFVWKRLGTTCENLPEAHMIIQALNALVSVVAPSMLFKSEAIVHPDDVVSYIDWEECPLSYNPTLMAMIWDGLATRRVDVLSYAMRFRYDLPPDCAWVNYLRVHDDIGWSFADADAARFGINGYDHRLFLNAFYTGRFEGSFARGVGFNYNPVNQDLRICGTTASLAGLEEAIDKDDPALYRAAVERILMAYSIILASGGVPLIYVGDEIATLNDYSYEDDPGKAGDSRWVHRPTFDWTRAASRDHVETPQGEVYTRLRTMIGARKAMAQLSGADNHFFDTGNPHILGFVRNDAVLCLFNFDDRPHTISHERFAAHWPVPKVAYNAAKGAGVVVGSGIELAPLDYLWLIDAKRTPAPLK
ncbi:MAG: amylosucrase, partial [Chloroflexota bacterium]